jgi:hypothetical protein
MARKNRHSSFNQSKNTTIKTSSKSNLPPISEITQPILSQSDSQAEQSLESKTFWGKLPNRKKEIAGFLGSGISALVITFIVSAFQIAGVIDMEIAHLLIFFAWLLVVIGVFVSETLLEASGRRTLTTVFSAAIVAGVILYGIDLWMVSKKANLDKKASQERVAEQNKVVAQSTPITQPLSQLSDEKLAAIEFNSEATKKLQDLSFKIELKRPFLPNELEHFRAYFQFYNNDKIELRFGCQGGVNKDGDLQILQRIWSDDKHAKYTANPYLKIVEGKNAVNFLTCGAGSVDGQLPYRIVNDLDKNYVRIYATESLVEKIKSISLIANNYKILSYNANKFDTKIEDPEVKWFVPLSDSEKAFQWELVGLKAPTEEIDRQLKEAEKIMGKDIISDWWINFAEFPPTKLPRWFQ